ncbi:MAG: aldehyde dehydrogenase family protein [Thermosphaera sp.]
MDLLRRDPFFKDIYDITNDLPRFKTYVSGEWRYGEGYYPVTTPIDGSKIAFAPVSSFETIDESLGLLYDKGRWSIRDTPGFKRVRIAQRIADLLEQHAEAFVEALVYNSGKTYQQARGEVAASISRLRDASLDARKIEGEYLPGDWDSSTLETEGIVRKEPYGVVLGIIPFNYPLFDAVSKFTYSMIAGNAVILKPPSADPLPVIMFAKVVEESGFPKTAFSIASVPGREADKLVSDQRISVISFTGSSSTGKQVLRSGGIKQYIMELGGGDPAVILSDADIPKSASLVAAGIYSYAGQRCDAIKLILVENPVYNDFKDSLIKELSKVVVGDPRRQETTMGPLIGRDAVDKALEAVRNAVSHGGVVLYGGERLGDTYMLPTLVELRDHHELVKTTLYTEEVFAPVSLITSFNNLEEAVKLINGRRQGLDLAVFGSSIDKIRYLVRYSEVGAVYVNDMPRHGIGYYPFGGRKESGIGREGIGYSIEYVMATKTIIYNFKGKGIYHYLI